MAKLPPRIKVKDDPGRPRVNIDWDKVINLLIAGCSGAEIAGNLGFSRETIYARCQQDNGIPFSQLKTQYHTKGDSLLRSKQFEKALKGVGDNTMLVWLGKNRLKQKDREDITVADTQVVDELIESLKKLKESQAPKDE